MKTIMKLSKLTIRDFKGIKSFILDAAGESVNVFGDNATGKTTIYDAKNWLLFDKDSRNQTKFQLKTVDEDGNEIHGLDHVVEAEFLLNDEVLTLKKSYKEKWTKKRGSATSEFTSHTTDHFIDGVPVQLKEYKAKVAEIINEDIFKLLTSPSYFNEQLKWQDRRSALLKICGDITDQDVISTNNKLVDLPGILNGKKIEDYRKIIAAKRKEINDELEKVPVRISEVHHNLPDISKLDKAGLDYDINYQKNAIEEKESEISRIRNGAEITEKQKQLREIESEILDIKNQHQAKNQDKVNKKRQSLYKVESDIDSLKHSIESKQRSITYNAEMIIRYENDAEGLREEWRTVNERSLDVEHDKDCPTCGQHLPDDQIQAAHDKAFAIFNTNKSNDLERINKKGQSIKETILKLKKENEDLKLELAGIEEKIKQKQEVLNGLNEEVKALEENVQDINLIPGYVAKTNMIDGINDEISQLRLDSQKIIDELQEEIKMCRSGINDTQSDLDKFKQYDISKKRIGELKEQERKLATEYEKLEHELHLTEEFIKTKVNLLEHKINSKFKYARFKLFKTQINGGLEEVCETLYKGVPYGSGLNNAARINVGLDIINTLSEHYEFAAPIFVDNAEAVTKLLDIDTQVISLIVSEKDKELRVESNGTTYEEAV